MTTENVNPENVFEMPVSVTIADIDDVAEILRKISSFDRDEFVLDFSKIVTITSPGIQLIVSLHKKLQSTGGILEIINPIPEVAMAFEDLGLSFILKKATEE